MATGRPVLRRRTIKKFILPLAVMAAVPAGLAQALPAQAATPPCVPSEGAPAKLGDWAPAYVTPWQTSDVAPDPDGQSGELNPLNLKQIGERETWAPGTTRTEATGWVREQPAGDRWSVKATKIVTDRAAYDVTVSKAVDQWYHWNGGNQLTAPAAPPAAGWGADNGSHNGLMNKEDYAANTVFDASTLGGKNASWFFHDVRAAVIEHHDAATHVEFIYERQVEAPGQTMYRWSVEERTFTPGKPPVECPSIDPVDPVEPVDHADPTDPNTPSVPIEVKGQTAQTSSPTQSASHASNQPAQPHTRGGNASAVPLSIDAGL